MPFDSTDFVEIKTRKQLQLELDLAILRAAREGVATRWIQRMYHAGGDRCAVGWLNHEARRHGLKKEAPRRFFNGHLSRPKKRVIEINDDPNGQYEVLTLFDCAIVRLERLTLG